MDRTKLLLAVVAALLLSNFAWRVYAGWGLITVDVEDAPLSEVIASVGRQGGIRLETNMEPDTKVTMRVRRVPLTEALESLAAVTDSRWRLAYLLGPDKSTVRATADSLRASQRPEGWRQVSYPMPELLEIDEEEDVPPDPRRDIWNVKPQDESTLQAYAENAARSTNVALMFPADWNPAISSTPRSGAVEKSIPTLAKAAGGRAEELFQLTRGGRRGRGDGEAQRGAARPPATPEQTAQREQRFAAMQERAQAEIEKLPPEQRTAAQARYDAGRAFWQEVRRLPEAERREKIQEHFSDPARAAAREERMAAREQRRTPEQRVQRYQRYVQRKAEAKQQ